MTRLTSQTIQKVVGFETPQDVAVLNNILQELNRRTGSIPSQADLAVIKYFTTVPTSADIPVGTLGIYDSGAGPKRFYFKTNLGALAYIETGYYDSDLGVWINTNV